MANMKLSISRNWGCGTRHVRDEDGLLVSRARSKGGMTAARREHSHLNNIGEHHICNHLG